MEERINFNIMDENNKNRKWGPTQIGEAFVAVVFVVCGLLVNFLADDWMKAGTVLTTVGVVEAVNLFWDAFFKD